MATVAQLAKSVKAAKHVYLCGNGGSAANAIHIANDLIACRIKAHALTADVATLTAIANDYDYKDIFARQIRVFGEAGDLLIALSGSGRSPNVLKAIRAAKEKLMTVWTITGDPYSTASRTAHFSIARGLDMQAAEEAQLKIGHKLMRRLKC